MNDNSPLGAPGAAFTIRELQVIRLLVDGLSSKEIARVLHISVKTVDCHRSSVKKKSGTRNIATLIMYALRNGIISKEFI